MTTRRPLRLAHLVAAVLLVGGCASGSGENQQRFFQIEPTAEKLPISLNVSESSLDYSSEASPNVGREVQAFIIGGPTAWRTTQQVMEDPRFTRDVFYGPGIRGGFLAGEALRNAASRLCAEEPSKVEGSVQLDLLYFQHYSMSEWPNSVRAILHFSAMAADSPTASGPTYSTYAFEWEDRSFRLWPNEEKDVMREFVEAAMSHWGRTIQAHLEQGSPDTGLLPGNSDGSFSGGGMTIYFHVFYELT